jgi:broad-specificity NMP kinase
MYKCLLTQSPVNLHDNLNQQSYQISKTVHNTHGQISDIISSYGIDSASHDVETKACNRSAADCLTTSVRSQNQTAILESGQQQGVHTAAGDRTEELDSVSREGHKDCGPEEDVSTCKIFNIHRDKYTQIQHIFCRVKIN